MGACGNGDEPAAAVQETPQESTFPVTLDAPNGSLTIEAEPEAIVSLSSPATESLFAIGAGDQVIAADETSNYPPEAPTTDLSGYQPNIEAIAGYGPDLVIASDDLGDLVASLEKLSIPVLLQPAATSLDDTFAQIEQLGEATGHVEEAEALVDEMTSEIDGIVADAPELDEPLTYFHELDTTYFTVTSATFIGGIYDLLGLENIADEAPKAGTGYPQLSEEFIIDADPDLIFLADTKCCDQDGAVVAARPGWDQIAAVQNDQVIELDDDIASRWGPRVVDFLRIVADAVAEASG
ncbi:MAG: ABC transporter substrate-binding protein [Actinobacteria bacterium]|nr:ABC transporter substrate-binding protein [Actinomycetota bacterium]